jgi:hypothetical protein
MAGFQRRAHAAPNGPTKKSDRSLGFFEAVLRDLFLLQADRAQLMVR